jgi:hypothetical protein
VGLIQHSSRSTSCRSIVVPQILPRYSYHTIKIHMTVLLSIQASRLGQTTRIQRQLCLKLVRVALSIQTSKPFAMHKILQHIGLYVLNRLNPSPGVELKFCSSAKDELHGSDCVRNSFRPTAERRHRMFKAFFAVQNPMIEAPPLKKKLNWKINPLIKWLNYVI